MRAIVQPTVLSVNKCVFQNYKLYASIARRYICEKHFICFVVEANQGGTIKKPNLQLILVPTAWMANIHKISLANLDLPTVWLMKIELVQICIFIMKVLMPIWLNHEANDPEHERVWVRDPHVQRWY